MNELQSLSQIFQNKLFRIPDYQRGYAWLDQQLRDFWEDLINLQPDRYHYKYQLFSKLFSNCIQTVFRKAPISIKMSSQNHEMNISILTWKFPFIAY